jgi:putative addiction module component (TIGR02574 family)
LRLKPLDVSALPLHSALSAPPRENFWFRILPVLRSALAKKIVVKKQLTLPSPFAPSHPGVFALNFFCALLFRTQDLGFGEVKLRRTIANQPCGSYNSVMILEKFPEVQKLSPSEKLLFVSELWNDLESHPANVPVSREIIVELDRRMELFKQRPEEFTTWEAVKARILGSP